MPWKSLQLLAGDAPFRRTVVDEERHWSEVRVLLFQRLGNAVGRILDDLDVAVDIRIAVFARIGAEGKTAVEQLVKGNLYRTERSLAAVPIDIPRQTAPPRA